MSRIAYTEKYRPLPKDRFFFDANVLIYIFSPIANSSKNQQAQYAAFLKKVIEAKSELFTSSLILSEFVNTCFRYEFNILKEQTPKINFKKDFRNTKKYETLVKEVGIIVNKGILGIAQKIDDGFTKIDTHLWFDDGSRFDFNDKYYQALANIENLKIVTDDGDFASSDRQVQIITANPKLLRSGRATK